ncbi:glycerophosphodiester phosphodiesterase family protein [Legionella sp. km772]|uniref:glycerophosphodiester phosphodiesterase family protein n=1 Tax=Legionella sp. km772 TaxID=2498111 RepID=UPI000F8D6E0C|nr:glycerophosphodiester phosphodiesterase family protein [Legionella sp. km772]RUR11166.1 hypothetical protein ELY15_07385 [Legionella sp. km772]
MRLIAHRGLSSRAPENTLAAFELAAQEQSNWVEFDVMLTLDEEPIIIHDDTLERTTNGEGRVGDRSYAYIRTLNAGKKLFPNNPEYHREKVPHLSEVIAVLTYRNLNANIEIKPCFCTTQEASNKVAWDTAKQILALLKKSWPASKPLPLISSFNPICLSYSCYARSILSCHIFKLLPSNLVRSKNQFVLNSKVI